MQNITKTIGRRILIVSLIILALLSFLMANNIYSPTLGLDLHAYITYTLERDLIYMPIVLIICASLINCKSYYLIRFKDRFSWFTSELKKCFDAVTIFSLVYFLVLVLTNLIVVFIRYGYVDLDLNLLFLAILTMFKRILAVFIILSITLYLFIKFNKNVYKTLIGLYACNELVYLFENFGLDKFIFSQIVLNQDATHVLLSFLPLILLAIVVYLVIGISFKKMNNYYFVFNLSKRISKTPLIILFILMMIITYMAANGNLSFNEYIGLFFEFEDSSIFIFGIQMLIFLNLNVLAMLFIDNLDVVKNKEFILRIGNRKRYNLLLLKTLVVYSLIITLIYMMIAFLMFRIFANPIDLALMIFTTLKMMIINLGFSLIFYIINHKDHNMYYGLIVVLAYMINNRFSILEFLTLKFCDDYLKLTAAIIIILLMVVYILKFLLKKENNNYARD